MGVYNATIITAAGQNLIADAIAGGEAVTFSSLKTSTHVYPAGTSLQNLTALDDVKQSVSPTSVEVYNNNVVQVSARVPNTGIATAYLINTIGLFGQVSGGAETLIAVLTASTPDEVPVFDPESPAAFIFNVQMTIQNADTVTFEVNDSGTATVADLNRVAQPFSGATPSAAGTVGRVPAPAAGADGKFLRGDATWAAPADMVENFVSSDVADGSATAWTNVSKLNSGENNASIFAKISQMFKNVRYLYKMLGTTDISAIGNGTVTNALSVINANWFHCDMNGLPSGYRAVQIIFDTSSSAGILFSDSTGNAGIIHGNWPSLTTYTNVTPAWISNNGKIEAIAIAPRGDSYRIKFLYATHPVTISIMSINGKVAFLRREFQAS